MPQSPRRHSSRNRTHRQSTNRLRLAEDGFNKEQAEAGAEPQQEAAAASPGKLVQNDVGVAQVLHVAVAAWALGVQIQHHEDAVVAQEVHDEHEIIDAKCARTA